MAVKSTGGRGIGHGGTLPLPSLLCAEPLQLHTGPQCVAAAVREHIQQLVVVPAVRAQRFIRDVQRFEDTR